MEYSFLSFILSLMITIFVYCFVPALVAWRLRNLKLWVIRTISIINYIIGIAFFYYINDGSYASGAAFLWSYVGYSLMKHYSLCSDNTTPSITDTTTENVLSHTSNQPKALNTGLFTGLFMLGISFLAIIFIVTLGTNKTNNSSNYNNTNNTSTSKHSQTSLTRIVEPASGTILAGKEVYDGSELTITASNSEASVIKLKTSSGVTRLSFYVRAGDTVTIGVPAEHLYVYFASGNTWYGTYHLFGDDTTYSMDDEILDFTQYTWEYTLYPITNGNFSETPIDASEF